MLKTYLSSVSLAALLLTSAPAFADQTPSSTTPPPPPPATMGVSDCMQKATAKKSAALKAAEEAFKTTKDKAKEGGDKDAAMKATEEAKKKAYKAAMDSFEMDRKACTAMAPNKEMPTKGIMEKKQEGKNEGKMEGNKPEKMEGKTEGNKGLEDLLKALQEKVKVLEEKIKVLEALLNPKMATVTLSTQNNSGESGTATLKEENGKVKVTLNLTGAPASVSQPAHVHLGSCTSLGGVKHSLMYPLNGKSETTLDTTFDQLKAGLPLAINVHKSETEAGVYVSCGDLKL